MPADLYGAMLRKLKAPPGLEGSFTSPLSGGLYGWMGASAQSPGSQVASPQSPGSQTPAPNTTGNIGTVSPYTTSTNDYDYDPEYDTTVRQLVARQNFLNSQYTQDRNRINTAYQQPLTNMQNQYGTDLQTLYAQMAQQGILRSSNNLQTQGKLSDAYQQQYGGLLTQRQAQQEGLDRNRAQNMQDILEQQISALGKHTQFVGEKEKERAALEAQAKAAEAARKQQEELARQLAQQAADAQKAFNDLVNPPPPTQTTATGAIVPAPPPPPTPYQQAYDWGGTVSSFDDPRVGTWDDPRFSFNVQPPPVAPPQPPPPPPPPDPWANPWDPRRGTWDDPWYSW